MYVTHSSGYGRRGRADGHARIRAEGRACHSSDPTQGRNAIVRLARAILAIDAMGGLHAAYWDVSNADLRYAHRPPGGLWTPETVTSAGNVGQYATIAVDSSGTVHIAARNANEDFQVWIDVGDVPALRRLVVSYRQEAGHPQYWAYFTDWEFGVKPDSRTFVFQPPAGAERIRLARTDEGEE